MNFFRGEFYKLSRTKPFRLCIIVECIYAVLKLGFKVLQSIICDMDFYMKSLVSQYEDAGYTASEIKTILDGIRNPQAFSLLAECCASMLICGLLAAMFFACDNSNGMLRQMISRGISRKKIYSNKLCTTSIGALSFTVVLLVIYFIGVGLIFHFGNWEYEQPLAYIIKYVMVVLLGTFTFTCFGQMMATIFKSKASCAIAVILTYFGSTVAITAFNMLLPASINLDYWWFCSIPFYMVELPIADMHFIIGNLIMILYCFVFYFIGYCVFRKKEL